MNHKKKNLSPVASSYIRRSRCTRSDSNLSGNLSGWILGKYFLSNLE